MCVLYDVLLERKKEPIAACQKTAAEPLPLEVVQYEIEYHHGTKLYSF